MRVKGNLDMRNEKVAAILSLLLSLALLSGCSGFTGIRNRENLSKLSPDMTKKEVLDVMGNPYRTESTRRKDKKIVEIIFYYTNPAIKLRKLSYARGLSPARPISYDELTPIVVVDGKVRGWGWPYYFRNAKRFELTSRTGFAPRR